MNEELEELSIEEFRNVLCESLKQKGFVNSLKVTEVHWLVHAWKQYNTILYDTFEYHFSLNNTVKCNIRQ